MKTTINVSLTGEEIRRRFINLKSQNEMSKRMSNSAFALYIFEMYEKINKETQEDHKELHRFPYGISESVFSNIHIQDNNSILRADPVI